MACIAIYIGNVCNDFLRLLNFPTIDVLGDDINLPCQCHCVRRVVIKTFKEILIDNIKASFQAQSLWPGWQ